MSDATGRLTESQRAMADALPHMVWTATPDGVVDLISGEFERITGMVGLNYANGDWLQGVHPDDHQPTLDIWNHCVATGQPYNTEFRIWHGATATYRWNYVAARPSRNAAGEITQWFGSTVDIHDNRVAEARFRSIYSMVPVGVLEEDWSGVRAMVERLRAEGITDFHAWCRQHPDFLVQVAKAIRITDANPAAVRLFQADSRRQLLGRLDDAFPGAGRQPAGRFSHLRARRHLLRGGSPASHLAKRMAPCVVAGQLSVARVRYRQRHIVLYRCHRTATA